MPTKYKNSRKPVKAAMRKKKARAAYKPKAKAIQKAKRRPFVECKTRSMLDIALINRNKDDTFSAVYYDPLVQRPLAGQLNYNAPPATYVSGFTNIPLRPFYRMSQGYRKDQMTGDSLYSRSLALRTEFEFPYDINQIVRPYSVYLVCGWVTNPTGFNNNTNPTDQGATMLDIEEHIAIQCQEYFDNKRDQLKFERNTNRNIKIDMYKKIKPNLNENTTSALTLTPGHSEVFAGATTFTGAQSGAQQFGPHSTQPGVNVNVPSTASGSIPQVRCNFTWDVNRKLHYTQGTAVPTGTDGDEEDTQAMLLNNQWLPFACVYCPDFLDMKGIGGQTDRFVQLRYNVQHRFSDS